jgi:hypothetical protein
MKSWGQIWKGMEMMMEVLKGKIFDLGLPFGSGIFEQLAFFRKDKKN